MRQKNSKVPLRRSIGGGLSEKCLILVFWSPSSLNSVATADVLGTNLLVVCGCHGHGHPRAVAMGTVAVATGVVASRCAGNKSVGGLWLPWSQRLPWVRTSMDGCHGYGSCGNGCGDVTVCWEQTCWWLQCLGHGHAWTHADTHTIYICIYNITTSCRTEYNPGSDVRDGVPEHTIFV